VLIILSLIFKQIICEVNCLLIHFAVAQMKKNNGKTLNYKNVGAEGESREERGSSKERRKETNTHKLFLQKH